MIESRIAAALVNACWQSAVLAGLAAIGVRWHGPTSARVRHAIWCAVLLVVVALPVLNVVWARQIAPVASDVPAPSIKVAKGPTGRLSRPPVELSRVLPAPRVAAQPQSTAPRREIAVRGIATLEASLAVGLQRIGAFLFWAWLATALTLLARLAYGMWLLAGVRRGLQPLDGDWFDRRHCGRRGVSVAAGNRIAVPCLIGFVRPTIAIPRSLVASLRSDDLGRVVLHEAAHAQRYDDWVNLLVQMARAVQFFNPIVHMIAAHIAVEREIACDDRVVELSGDRLIYAECLSTMAKTFSFRGAHAVPGFLGGRAQIVVRVEQLLDRAHDSTSRVGRKSLAAIATLAAIALGLVQVGIPFVAVTAATPQQTDHASVEAIPESAGPLVVVHAAGRGWGVHSAKSPRGPEQTILAWSASAANFEGSVPLRTAAIVVHRRAAAKAYRTRVAVADPPADASIGSSSAAASASESAIASAPQSAVASASNSEPDLIDELAAAGYRGLSVDQLIRLRDHGVDGKFIAAIKSAGVSGLSVDDLIRARDRGVDPHFIGAFRAAGYDVRIGDLVRLRDHGVDAELVRSLNAGARRHLSVDELVTLRDHGVDASYANKLAAAGVVVPFESLVTLRDHGVDPEYIASLTRAGYSGLSAGQLIALRDHGVTSDFIGHVRHLFAPGHQPSVEELIKMRDSGI